MTSPNIRPTVKPHSECRHLDLWKPLNTRVGDVKYCVYGKIMLRCPTAANSRLQGPGMDWWLTLSPIFHPFTYRQAKKALAGTPRR